MAAQYDAAAKDRNMEFESVSPLPHVASAEPAALPHPASGLLLASSHSVTHLHGLHLHGLHLHCLASSGKGHHACTSIPVCCLFWSRPIHDCDTHEHNGLFSVQCVKLDT